MSSGLLVSVCWRVRKAAALPRDDPPTSRWEPLPSAPSSKASKPLLFRLFFSFRMSLTILDKWTTAFCRGAAEPESSPPSSSSSSSEESEVSAVCSVVGAGAGVRKADFRPKPGGCSSLPNSATVAGSRPEAKACCISIGSIPPAPVGGAFAVAPTFLAPPFGAGPPCGGGGPGGTCKPVTTLSSFSKPASILPMRSSMLATPAWGSAADSAERKVKWSRPTATKASANGSRGHHSRPPQNSSRPLRRRQMQLDPLAQEPKGPTIGAGKLRLAQVRDLRVRMVSLPHELASSRYLLEGTCFFSADAKHYQEEPPKLIDPPHTLRCKPRWWADPPRSKLQLRSRSRSLYLRIQNVLGGRRAQAPLRPRSSPQSLPSKRGRQLQASSFNTDHGLGLGGQTNEHRITWFTLMKAKILCSLPAGEKQRRIVIVATEISANQIKTWSQINPLSSRWASRQPWKSSAKPLADCTADLFSRSPHTIPSSSGFPTRYTIGIGAGCSVIKEKSLSPEQQNPPELPLARAALPPPIEEMQAHAPAAAPQGQMQSP